MFDNLKLTQKRKLTKKNDNGEEGWGMRYVNIWITNIMK